MNITIPYGTGTVSADMPEQIQTFLLDPSCPKLDGDDAARIEAALDNPIGTPRRLPAGQRPLSGPEGAGHRRNVG